MKNSWGQELEIGSVVYRGARLGNGSEYKLGVVCNIKNGKATVEWKYTANSRWINVDGELVVVPYLYEHRASKGTPSIESLIVVDLDFDELSRQASFHKIIDRNMKFNSIQEYKDAFASFSV